MDKYLLQILHQVNTIIIPELGALTVTKKDSMNLMFMPFLKHDDGNLSKIISEKEGISINEAKNLIAKYVREIHNKLDKGESYDMYQFGKFYKENGEIKFSNWIEYNNQINENDNYLIVNQDIESEKLNSEEKQTKSIDEVLMNSEDLQNNNNVNKVEELLDNNLNEKKNSIDFNNAIDSSNHFENNSKLKSDLKNDKEVNKKYTEDEIENEIKKSVKNNNEYLIKIKKKKPISFYILIILFIVFCSSTIIYLTNKVKVNSFFYKIKHSALKNKNNENNLKTEIELDSIEQQISQNYNNTSETNNDSLNNEIKNEIKKEIENDTKYLVKNENEKASLNQIQNIDYRNKYHLIVGGFSSEENAIRFANKLNKENGKALLLGKFNDKFLVSYSYFSNKSEAIAEMKQIPLNSWVFFY